MIVRRRSYKDLIPVFLCVLMLGAGWFFAADPIVNSDWDNVPPLCTLGVSINPLGGGSVSPPSGSRYELGTQVTLTATPSPGYEFDHWSGTDSNYTNLTTVTMNSNRSITAYFTEIEYSLSISVSPPGSGSISPSSGNYNCGDQVTLIATASLGYEFDHWSWDADGTSPTITIIMNSNKNVVANFTTIRYSLSISVSPPGSGSISPSSGTFDSGIQVTLTATPASSRYVFDRWSDTDDNSVNPTTVTMNSNKNVVAKFRDLCPQRIALDMGSALWGFYTYEIEFSCYLNAGEEVTGFVEWERDYTWGWQFNVYDPYGNRIPDASWKDYSRRHPFKFIASCDGEYIIEMVNLGDFYAPEGVMKICPPGWRQTEY